MLVKFRPGDVENFFERRVQLHLHVGIGADACLILRTWMQERTTFHLWVGVFTSNEQTSNYVWKIKYKIMFETPQWTMNRGDPYKNFDVKFFQVCYS